MLSLSARFPTFLKMRKFLLDMKKDFLIMSNFYLIEILSEPNSLTMATSKKNTQNEQLWLILSIFFLITRIRNLQCKPLPICLSIDKPQFPIISRKIRKQVRSHAITISLSKFLTKYYRVLLQGVVIWEIHALWNLAEVKIFYT